MNVANQASAAPVARHRFTIEEYHKMGEAGIFDEDDRVELVDGEVIEMTPIGKGHVRAVNVLADLLADVREPGAYTISVQNPLVLGEHLEYQPDLAILRAGRNRDELPRAADALLVIEVSHTSLRRDREEKVPAYASSDIPEVWIVDLEGGAIEVYSEPSRGRYQSLRTAHRRETVVSGAVGEILVSVDEVLGSQASDETSSGQPH